MADGLDIKVKVEGDEAIVKMLAGLGLDIKDLRGAMGSVGRGMKTYFSGNVFASRGGAIGEPWDPLNAKYAVRKAKKWPGRPPMIRSGLMQKSFKYSTTSMDVTIRNSAPYFKYHQSSAPRSKLPRRVMLKLTDQVIDDSKAIIAKSLAEKVRKRSR